jgi:hypothetical protein
MLAAAADLLDLGQLLDRLSLAVTAIAAGVLLVPALAASLPVAGLVVVAGIAELMLAARVRFDAAAFRRLAADASADRLAMDAFDGALTTLGIMPAGKAGRDIAARFAGASRLLALQAAALLVQLAITVLGAFLLGAS